MDELLLINIPWSQEFPGVLRFLDLSLLPLVISLILTVISRLLHLYSTNHKTSRLMEERFSTMRGTQKSSLNYMEKRTGRREIAVTRRRRGGIKRAESNLDSNQIPMCSPQPGTPERFTELHR